MFRRISFEKEIPSQEFQKGDPREESFTIQVRERNPLLSKSERGILYYPSPREESFTNTANILSYRWDGGALGRLEHCQYTHIQYIQYTIYIYIYIFIYRYVYIHTVYMYMFVYIYIYIYILYVCILD